MGDLGRALCLMPSAAVIIYRSSGPRDRNALKGQTGTPAGCRGATLQGRCRGRSRCDRHPGRGAEVKSVRARSDAARC